jgi:hypothetical protein
MSCSSPASRDFVDNEGAAVAVSNGSQSRLTYPTATVLEFCLLASHDACNAAKHLRSLERRRNVVLVALCLPHVYANLQRAVDLAVLHEISPCDARVLVVRGPEVALLDILGQVQLDVAE